MLHVLYSSPAYLAEKTLCIARLLTRLILNKLPSQHVLSVQTKLVQICKHDLARLSIGKVHLRGASIAHQKPVNCALNLRSADGRTGFLDSDPELEDSPRLSADCFFFRLRAPPARFVLLCCCWPLLDQVVAKRGRVLS